MAQRRQQHKVLPAKDLDVDVLHGVAVKACHRPRVSYPEIDGVGLFLESYTGKGNVFLCVGEERDVLVAEVVVL